MLDKKMNVFFYSSYVKTYLERDVHDLLQIKDRTLFLRFFKVMVARTAQILNVAEIARDVDISPNTAK